MKKNKFKMVIIIAFATVMAAGTFIFTPIGTSKVYAASETEKDIRHYIPGINASGYKYIFSKKVISMGKEGDDITIVNTTKVPIDSDIDINEPSIPFFAIGDVPNSLVEKCDITFNMEVKFSDIQKISDDKNSSTDTNVKTVIIGPLR